MLHHRTTSVEKRAEHIADHEEGIREKQAIERFWGEFDYSNGTFGPYPYSDWPGYWLDVYDAARTELQSKIVEGT